MVVHFFFLKGNNGKNDGCSIDLVKDFLIKRWQLFAIKAQQRLLFGAMMLCNHLCLQLKFMGTFHIDFKQCYTKVQEKKGGKELLTIFYAVERDSIN